MNHDATLNKLRERLGADGFTTSEFRDNTRVTAKQDQLYAVLECLKQQCGFDLLVDITAADYLHYPDARGDFPRAQDAKVWQFVTTELQGSQWATPPTATGL